MRTTSPHLLEERRHRGLWGPWGGPLLPLGELGWGGGEEGLGGGVCSVEPAEILGAVFWELDTWFSRITGPENDCLIGCSAGLSLSNDGTR